jgi:hypothetical protein
MSTEALTVPASTSTESSSPAADAVCAKTNAAAATRRNAAALDVELTRVIPSYPVVANS